MKKVIGLLALLAVGIAAYSYYSKLHAAPDSSPPGGAHAGGGGGLPVNTYTVTTGTLHQTIKSVGTLMANESATVSAEVAGKVMKVQFTEGQSIKAGAPLIAIDESTYAQNAARDKAAYDLAQATYKRRLELRKAGVASVQVKDEAEAVLLQAKAARDESNLRLAKTTLRAPFDGIMGMRKVSIGDYLEVGAPVTEIVSLDPMKVEFSFPEKYFSQLKDGAAITLKVDAWPGREFSGTLYAIDPKVNPETRNITAKATLANPDAALRPGMFAYVYMDMGSNAQALVIPEEALIPGKDKLMVMTVVDGKVKSVPVVVGARADAKAEIVSGLQEGDVVITAGQMKVQEGMPVTAMPAAVAGSAPQAVADPSIKKP